MANLIDDDIILKQIHEQVEPATEDMRKAFNLAVERYDLKADLALFSLARLAANFIHQMQKDADMKNLNEVVEERFQQMLAAHLTDLEMSERVNMIRSVGDIGIS